MTLQVDSERIQQERKRRAWTQQHLAEVSGLGMRTIQRIEKSATASPESVQALAACFGLGPSDLMVLPEQGAPAHRRWLRWPATAAAVVAALTLIAVASVPNATARNLTLDVEAVVTAEDDRYEHIGQMTLADREQSQFQMNRVFRILVTPTILDESRVSIALKIFAFTEGEYVLTSEPSLTTRYGREAVFQLGLKTEPPTTIRVSMKPGLASEA
jgi:transcriptional regulator with XRE-family HTH domain